ncbi:MAG: GIY-YIG nuclease family protein [Candidatus Paceibacterota bacterium]|jgi:putative endonuclease
MAIYFVYAIKSEKDGRIYVGLSSNPERRLLEHNSSDTKSTRAFKPWRLIYKQSTGTRQDARVLEKKLKSGSGKEFLKTL